MSVSLSRSSDERSPWSAPLRASLGLHAVLVAALAVPAGWLWLFGSGRHEVVPIEFREVVRAKPDAATAIRASETAKEAPGRAVFGASRQALRDSASDSVLVKTGNTVTKEEDDETLTDRDPDALPSPVDDYLVERMPEVVSDVRVPYPAQAKERGVQGAVTLELLIDSDGAVRHAAVVDGPGHGLDEAALEAAKRFRFRPAVADGGKSVAVKIRYAYRFVLEP